MASRAIKPKRDDTLLSGFESRPEQAPSIIQEEQAGVARFLALVGLFLLALGLFAIIAPLMGRGYFIGPSVGVLAITIGLMFLLYHALTDRDVQYRFMYLVFGYIMVALGVLSRMVEFRGETGGLFLAGGVPCLLLGLVFVMAALRFESEDAMRRLAAAPFAIIGFLAATIGYLGGHIDADFLQNEGVVYLFIGLLFVCCYLALQAPGYVFSHRFGIALITFGLINIGLTLLRLIAPQLLLRLPLISIDLRSVTFQFVPSGIILLTSGVVYLGVGLGICSDRPTIVMTRRELASYFFSPIGYLVFFGSMLVAALSFLFFIRNLAMVAEEILEGRGILIPPPVYNRFFFNFFFIIGQAFIVPVLTMRLLSEEARSGTLEMALIAPITERQLILSKFVAAYVGYILSWLPWCLFVLALRAGSGEAMDFRPLFTFLIALSATGASFLAIGVFFSSLTNNQVIAAVLTFVAMMAQWIPFFRNEFVAGETFWDGVLLYVSPLDLWQSAIQGNVVPRYLIYYVSSALFFLFLSVKVLESRKWK